MQTIEIQRTDELSYQASEAYKSLRTNLMFSGEDVKVVAITSCMPNEGKTSVSINLACSLAEAGKHVLYIDADMRRSVVVGRYKMTQATFGLSHYLSGQKKLEEVLSQTNLDGMNMIVAGTVPPNPSELLGGKRFADLIRAARSTYDYIIVDTPPMGSVTDSAVVARQCDGVALVIASGEISYKFAQKVKSQLEQAGSKILGVILNKLDLSKNSQYGRYYKKYYGGFYGKYGKEEE